jgi:RND family efflux transporter MFP subunit
MSLLLFRRIAGRPVLFAVSLLALAGGLAAVGLVAQEQDTGSETTLRPVRLLTIAEPNTAVTRQFYGQVVARQTVDLAFQVGGQLTELPVRNGQSVAEGDLLASLDPVPFARAVERAELNLQQAQRDFDRVQQLAQSNVASEARFDEAQTALDLAKVSLREARDAQNDATLTAAFDGLVAQRLVANFTTVAQGTPVLRLHDMSEPRVEIDVPERLFQQGQSADGLRITADFGPDRPAVPLELAEFTAETQGVAQSYTVDLALPADAGFTPLPGRTTTVTVNLPMGTNETLTVPMTALIHDADRGTQVMIFEPVGADAGTVRPLTVEIVSREGSEVAIAPDGNLEPGMEIVASGAHLLTEGQQVRRFTGFREAR